MKQCTSQYAYYTILSCRNDTLLLLDFRVVVFMQPRMLIPCQTLNQTAKRKVHFAFGKAARSNHCCQSLSVAKLKRLLQIFLPNIMASKRMEMWNVHRLSFICFVIGSGCRLWAFHFLCAFNNIVLWTLKARTLQTSHNYLLIKDPHGELVKKNVLIVRESVEKTAKHFELDVTTTEDALKKGCEILFEERLKRPKPHLDTKMVTSWNGMSCANDLAFAFFFFSPGLHITYCFIF